MAKKSKISTKLSLNKIFIAGGTGFLGQHLAERLRKDKIPYVATSISRGIDFRDLNNLKKIFKKEKPNIIVNVAAFVGGIQFGYEKPAEIFLNNTLINANLIECAKEFGVSLFVNILPNCTYPGALDKPFKENQWWDGPIHESVLSYGMSRKASWVNAWAYHKQYGMNFANLIFTNMYGPGDHFDEVRSHALGALIKKIVAAKNKNEKEVVVWGSGDPIREWLYVDDGVEAIMRAIKFRTSLGIEPINIGPGKGVSIKKLAQLIKKESGYKGKLVFDTSKPDGAPYKVFNVSKCKKSFGWVPKTKLEDGLKRTIKYYEEIY
ncbi:MAG: GDP-L-fucose synthetase [Candidatus Yanofskybacteria bacterium CG10_big_fil_rev_8_21_14_0_10_36_16]|uniref:GDP-L-fucose synthase n=1 Tax=Candidatus Yanofskybacteria bacterium CG10_big_fil_rev_8_21_14_0_10_36_16 TaxID=1975096 RepID=A0A2J0Q7H9_9BACT|nr:MAG: GDP-L-fucose synthetase [Candidatus Yanofskybacteria bacterium CG10_big_fil_rev_8_21_14_0_10_36_16]